MLGENLKNIRNKMGISLSEASSMTGVSKTMLSQIERSESIPTIATTWKIANGLKIKFETLLENESILYDLKSIDNTTPLTDADGKMIVYCLFPFMPMRGFELFYVIMKPGCDYLSEAHKNSSSEYLMISKGEAELIVDEEIYDLKEGSVVAFNSTKKHRYVNKGDSDVIAWILVNYE